MSVRMRHTRAHTNNRRSHHALTAAKPVKDKESGKLRLPHRLDESTGVYRGKQLVAPKQKKRHEHKRHGPDTEPKGDHKHEHAAHDHANAETKGNRGLMERLTGGGRAKSRSGLGGGGV